MTDTLLDADDARLLLETGFLALTGGETARAKTIFEGVVAARPAEEAGSLGLAMALMAENALDEATAILRALPPSDAALTYLGLCLARSNGRAEAARLLSDVAETAADPAFRTLAAQAMEDFRL